MKKLALIILLYAVQHTCLCQQVRDKRTDSAMATKVLNGLKGTINITTEQEGKLYEAVLKASEDRRKVFRQFWKTEKFAEELAKVEYQKDLAIQKTLGVEKYLEYKAMLNYKRLQFEDLQRMRYKQYEDSVMHKQKRNEP